MAGFTGSPGCSQLLVLHPSAHQPACGEEGAAAAGRQQADIHDPGTVQLAQQAIQQLAPQAQPLQLGHHCHVVHRGHQGGWGEG